MEQWDVIGAGVVGSAVAHELARYRLRVAVLEKELDVACGNGSRNTGMLHAGFTYKPGSLKAECAVEGNKEFDQVAAELGVPFRRTGKLVVGFTEHDRENILKFKAIGEKNGVTFLFDHRVDAIERDAATDRYLVRTSRGTVATKWVVNCAGAYASMVSEMLGYPNYPVRGFKGEYFVLDKRAGEYLKVPVYPAPNDRGGFSTHATPTVDGNILVGPDSYITEGWEDYACTKEHLDGLIRDGSKMFKQMRREYFIRNFAGIRWKRVDEDGNVLDFMLESDQQHNPNTVNLVGIESPGVTCALPLARRAVARLVEVEKPQVNEDFDPVRPSPSVSMT